MEGFSVPAWVAPGGCWVQCWDRTAEGPRGPGCVGQCEIRGFLHKISRGLQTCWFGACSPDPIYPPPRKCMVLRLPRLVQQFPEVTVYS